MKKIISIFWVLLMCISLSACSSQPNQNQKLNEISDTLLIALESKDEKTIKNLMAPKLANTSETLTTEIQRAFEFFEGNVISCKNIENVSEGEKYDNGKLIYLRIGNARIPEIITDINTYRISFSAVLINAENTDQEGVWRIWIGKDNGESIVIGSDDYDL